MTAASGGVRVEVELGRVKHRTRALGIMVRAQGQHEGRTRDACRSRDRVPSK